MNKNKPKYNITDNIETNCNPKATESAVISEINNAAFEKFGMWYYFDNVKKISVIQFLKILKELNTPISEFGKKLKK